MMEKDAPFYFIFNFLKSWGRYINIRQSRFQGRQYYQDKGGYFIMIKWLIHQRIITILNIYGPDNRASTYMKQKLIELQGEIEKSSIIPDILATCHTITEKDVWRSSDPIHSYY